MMYEQRERAIRMLTADMLASDVALNGLKQQQLPKVRKAITASESKENLIKGILLHQTTDF